MSLLLGVALAAADHGRVDEDRTDHGRPDRDRGDRDRKDHDRGDPGRKDRDRGDHDRKDRDREDTLLVWASDQAHVAPDFLAVIDFDRDSRTYGKVLDTVPLIGAGAVGNEPHHVGLSRDGRTLALGGLLSVLRGQDQVFFSMSATHAIRRSFARTIRRGRPSPTSSLRSGTAAFW